MARYDKEHKAATRQRILESAGLRFKEGGIDGSGIAALMSGAGLTNGAFYAHFDSKEELVASVIAEQMSAQAATMRALPSGRAGLELFIRAYLTPEHRDSPSAGCPSAALLDEIARSPHATKHAYAEGAGAIIAEIASRLGSPSAGSTRAHAIGLYTMLVGTMQLARAIDDDDLSREVLESGVANADALLR